MKKDVLEITNSLIEETFKDFHGEFIHIKPDTDDISKYGILRDEESGNSGEYCLKVTEQAAYILNSLFNVEITRKLAYDGYTIKKLDDIELLYQYLVYIPIDIYMAIRDYYLRLYFTRDGYTILQISAYKDKNRITNMVAVKTKDIEDKKLLNNFCKAFADNKILQTVSFCQNTEGLQTLARQQITGWYYFNMAELSNG